MVRTLSDENLDESDRKLLSDIEQVGWHVVLIPPEADTPGWAFSIGLFHTFKHPEVVVFGLPLEVYGQVINGIGDDVQKGCRFQSHEEYPDLLEGVACVFRHVERGWYREFLGYAGWYYQGMDFPVLQCIWPDKQQHFPWQPEFRQSWLWAQPLLYESEPGPARVTRLLETMEDDPTIR
jgi:hypothetical protein